MLMAKKKSINDFRCQSNGPCENLDVLTNLDSVKPEHGASKGESGVPVVLVVAHRSQRIEHLEV